jgi:hypothetical protein
MEKSRGLVFVYGLLNCTQILRSAWKTEPVPEPMVYIFIIAITKINLIMAVPISTNI